MNVPRVLSEAEGRQGVFEGAQPLHQAPSGAARSAGGKHRYLHKKGHRRKSMTFFVEIVGLEPSLQPFADTLVLVLSIAYFVGGVARL